MPNADTETVGDLPLAQPPPAGPDDQLSELEQDNLRIKASVAYYAVPVALIHLAIIYTVVSAKTGWRLPSWADDSGFSRRSGPAGAIVGTLLWGIRRGGIPRQGELWLRDWPARLLIIGLILFATVRIIC